MKASFWKALEALGASGAAACDWRLELGSDWDACTGFLRPSGRSASTVIDPRHPSLHAPRRIALMVDGEEDFVAVDDDPSLPPIPFRAADVVEMQPSWEPIRQALATALGFDHGAWENHGSLRRIGSSQDPFGRVTPVLLFLPPGHLGDYQGLFRELSARSESTVLFPGKRWFTAEIEALRARNHLEFVDLAERLASIDAEETLRALLPAITRPRGPAGQEVRAVIHAGNGLTWEQVRVGIVGNQTIHLKAPGQDGSYSFPKRAQLGPEHPLGILMSLAAKGEWRNPPPSSADYERVSKAFHRLRSLLSQLVPLPGKPFKRSRGAFVPLFEVGIHPRLLERG
jgi:hypothetical protein